MGTPAQATGHVSFESPEALSLVVKQIDEWIDKTKNGFPVDSPYHGDYEIELDEWQEDKCYFNFSAFSSRAQNLDWQMEMFHDFCRTLPGVTEFQADIMVQGDGTYWRKN